MRIGINTLFLVPGDVGGTEVYLRSTLTAMASAAEGDTLVLFTNKENDRLFRTDLASFPQVEFRQMPCRAAIRPLRILAEQLFLPPAARKERIDVLWSPGYTAPALCFSPQAVTVCDLQYKSCPEDMNWLERTVLDVLVRTSCRQCQAVLTISEFSRQEVVSRQFAPAEKVCAVPLGVHSGFAQNHLSSDEAAHALQRLGVRKPFLFCVAHTYPHKNIDKLIDAFALLQDRLPHQLTLVGKKRRGEEAVGRSLLKVKQPERVLRLQGLTEQDLQALYQEADVFVLPSSYEGFGLPLIEALMAGLPAVAVRKASLPEVGGEHPFYADESDPALLAEKIVEALELPESERRRRAKQGQEWARRFAWERTAGQTLQILRSLARKA